MEIGIVAIAAIVVVLVVIVAIVATIRASTRQPLTGAEEARRLARLLVSEIALYNDELVEDSQSSQRLHPDLVADLKRSRAMFEDRVSSEDMSNHFEEAVRNIIAGGDPAIPIELE